jgi:hypothetical protein
MMICSPLGWLPLFNRVNRDKLAGCLAAIAGKPGSHRLGKILKIVHDLVGASLLAMNDDAVVRFVDQLDPVRGLLRVRRA